MYKKKTLLLHDDSDFRINVTSHQALKNLLKQFIKSLMGLIFPDKRFQNFHKYVSTPTTAENRNSKVQVIVKESFSDYRVQTSREALDCSNLAENSPVRILKTKLYCSIKRFQFGIFLQQHLQTYKSLEIAGYYKTDNGTYDFGKVISSDTFKGFSKPTYWIDIIVEIDGEKLENTDSMEVYLSKVNFSKDKTSKNNNNSPILVSDILPQSKRYQKKKGPVVVLSFDGISARDIYNSINDFPNLNQFATENCLYKNAITSSTVTATSAASLITGLSLPQHYIYNYDDYYISPSLKSLSPQISTIAQDLRDIGVITQGLFTFGRWAPQYGLSRGFTSYRSVNSGSVQNFPWLNESIKAIHANKNNPFTFMLHHPGAHPPFTPKIRTSIQDSEYAAYYENLTYVDIFFGNILLNLKALNLYDDALIIFLADHGRSLRSEYSRKKRQFEEVRIRVPLIVKNPDWVDPHNAVQAQDYISAQTTAHELISRFAGLDYKNKADDSFRTIGGIKWVCETCDYTQINRIGMVGFDQEHKHIIHFNLDYKNFAVKDFVCLESYNLKTNKLIYHRESSSGYSPRKQQILDSAIEYLEKGLQMAIVSPTIEQSYYTEILK